MDKGVLQKYTARVDGDPDRSGVEGDDVDDLGTFGWLRGIRERCPMLELRKKTGDILAIGYGWMERAAFDPSTGITLRVGSQAVLIKGRNLNAEVRTFVRLFEGIARHRVPWIREATQAELIAAKDSACIVESINW